MYAEFMINGDAAADGFKCARCRLFDWIGRKEEALNSISKDGYEIVVIDSYLADENYYKSVSNLVRTAVYIDDNKRLYYPGGVVVNGNIYAEETGYPAKDGNVYLLGSGYALVRKEFWAVEEKTIKDNIDNIMVIFGGSDMRNMVPGILKEAIGAYPEAAKKIIVGRGFRNVEDIRKAAGKKADLIFSPSAKEMVKLMLEADIAVSAGGQTLNELARVGVPTITVAVADNQLANVKGWEKTGFAVYAGYWEDRDIHEKIKARLDSVKNRGKRQEMSIAGRRKVDGAGAKRVVNEILNVFSGSKQKAIN